MHFHHAVPGVLAAAIYTQNSHVSAVYRGNRTYPREEIRKVNNAPANNTSAGGPSPLRTPGGTPHTPHATTPYPRDPEIARMRPRQKSPAALRPQSLRNRG